jgi:hypothetical protein
MLNEVKSRFLLSGKKIFIFLVGGILFFLIVSFVSKSTNLLTYIESSSGLQTVQMESGRTEIKLADVNNDGYKDLLSIGDHGNPYVNTQEHGIMTWFGNGTGANWNLIQWGNFGYGGIAIGDVNNDGKMDVGLGMHHNYATSGLGTKILDVGLGDGTGLNWVAYDSGLATNGETWGMFNTDFADVNNDGFLDIGSVSFGCCAGIHVYKNLGNGIWTQTFGFTGGNATNMEFVFGDIDNDGNVDFAASHQYGTPYFNDGTGNYTLKHNNLPSPGSAGIRGCSLGDVDNDGAKELALISSGGGVQVWKWNRITQLWIDLSANLPSSGSFQITRIVDMNTDGFADVATFGNGICKVFAGNGGTNWTEIASFTTPSPGTYRGFAIGDVDNNCYPDIMICTAEGSTTTRNTMRCFKETTPYTSMIITPVFPKGFERFKNNSIQLIEWVSASPPSQTTKIKIELSTTGAGGPWTLVADTLKNSGRYQWHVPTGISSSNCRLRFKQFRPGTTDTVTSITPNSFIIGILLGVEQLTQIIPDRFSLSQNYPNPFNAISKIKFEIPPFNPPLSKGGRGGVSLKVYDILGKELQTLVNEQLQPGTYEVTFDGSGLASGIYFYQLKAGEFLETKKLVLLK